MVLSGRVDGAAIDSTVLEWLTAQRGVIADEIREIETIGPSPIPPWVISRRVPETLRTAIRALLLALHRDPFGTGMLDGARIHRFVPTEDRDYDPIRAMARSAARVSFV
jgi:phosphonate transport system substrate-binding protein